MVRLLILLMLFCALSPSWSQNSIDFAAPDPGKGFVGVSVNWRFHTGDDLAWAQAGYDDRGWESLRGDTTWGAQTHQGYTGFAWYRKPIQIGEGKDSIILLMPPVDDTYELYWNGLKIGGSGKLPPHASWDAAPHPSIFALPNSSGVLALRVWKPKLATTDAATVGGMEGQPLLGDGTYLKLRAEANRVFGARRALPALVTSCLMTVSGLISLLLFLRERTRCDGVELPVFGSLPLGITPVSAYEDFLFRLQEGETLVLYTDGIIEARNAQGELFGFERTLKLVAARSSAEQLVEAACVFGQQDDITVLSIRRLAAKEAPAEARVSLTTQIATVSPA